MPPVISIVDDDAWSRSGIAELIASLGFEVRTFESAEEFMQSGGIEDAGCLITDLQLPGASGLDLQSHVRSKGLHTPVIIITAYPDDQSRQRAFADGAVAFLSKPLDEKALVACLTQAIKPHG